MTLDKDNQPGNWKSVYRLSCIASIMVLIIIPIQIAIYVISPIPKTIESWFLLFQNSWLLGLLHQDLLYLINNILVALMYLGFYVSLRKYNESVMKIALLLGLLGISAYFASCKAFEMLSLSKLYFAASSETVKSMLLIAGQSALAEWQGTAFLVYYVLNGITLVLISIVMIKSKLYGKVAAWIGFSAGILMMIPSTAGTIGLVFSLASLVPWCVFCALVAIQFNKLSKNQEN